MNLICPLAEEVITSKSGRYKAELQLPSGILCEVVVDLEAGKPAHKTSDRIRSKKICKQGPVLAVL